MLSKVAFAKPSGAGLVRSGPTWPSIAQAAAARLWSRNIRVDGGQTLLGPSSPSNSTSTAALRGCSDISETSTEEPLFSGRPGLVRPKAFARSSPAIVLASIKRARRLAVKSSPTQNRYFSVRARTVARVDRMSPQDDVNRIVKLARALMAPQQNFTLDSFIGGTNPRRC